MEVLYRNLTEDKEDSSSFEQLPFLPRFFLVFFSTVTILSNLTVLTVLGRMRSCLTKMQLFLQSLAVADLLVGLMWIVLHLEAIAGHDLYHLSDWLCLMFIHLPTASLAVSVLTLSLISVERYIAVVKPLQYHRVITRRRAKYSLAAVWLSTIALFVPVYVALLLTRGDLPKRHCEDSFSEVLYTCMYILSIVIVPNVFLSFYCYAYIIKSLILRDKFLEKNNMSIRRSRRRNDRTLAKISISVYSGFYISWLPFVFISFVAYIDVMDISDMTYYSMLNTGMCNSLLNCFIYSISHKPFRSELKLLVCSVANCCFCCCWRRPATKRVPWHVAARRAQHHPKGLVKTISQSVTGSPREQSSTEIHNDMS